VADFFISSRTIDLPAARVIRRELEAAGYSCWLYADDPMPRPTWITSLVAEIDACRGMVVVLSRNAVSSDRIHKEVELGSARGKPTLAIRLEDVPVDGSLAYLLMLSPRVDAFPGSLDSYGEAIRSAAQKVVPAVTPGVPSSSPDAAPRSPRAEGLVVFISYRRQDSGGRVHPLYESLVERLGRDQVFVDVDTIEPGEDWHERIDRAIDTSDVVLVVIGPWWTAIEDPAGARRLDSQNDRLRAEIAAALDGAPKRVIPVLVGGATMPREADLPDGLRSLVHRQAVDLSPTRFRADVDDLMTTLLSFEARKRSGTLDP